MTAERADATPREHRSHAPSAVGCYVLTVSDSKTPETDTSGQLIRELLGAAGQPVVGHAIVRDDPAQVVGVVKAACEQPDVGCIILTGGTGITSRDSTLE